MNYPKNSPFERHSPLFFIPLIAKSTTNSATVHTRTDTPSAARCTNVNCHQYTADSCLPRYFRPGARAHSTSKFQNIIPYLQASVCDHSFITQLIIVAVQMRDDKTIT